MLALDGDESADAGSDVDADAGRVLRRDLEPAVIHRELRGGNRVLDEEVHLLDVLLLDEGEGVEALHLRRDLRGIAGDVELRDTRHAARSGEQRRPRLVGADSERRHQSDAGDDDAPVHDR